MSCDNKGKRENEGINLKKLVNSVAFGKDKLSIIRQDVERVEVLKLKKKLAQKVKTRTSQR